jgi:ribosomal protein L32
MELRICREHGISHSHFLGGRNRWNDSDRAKAKALAFLDLEECPNCHTLREDWMGVDEDGNETPLSEPVWTPDFKSCPGCGEVKRAEKHMTDDQRERGGFVTLVPLVEYVARAEP